MIDTKELALSSFLYKVKDQAAEMKERRFCSFTREIDSINFLDMFDQCNHRHEDRYYWSNHRADFCLFGIGTAKEFVSLNGEIEDVQQAWNNLLLNVDEYNPYKLPGTGMTAVGGMAFDPNDAGGELWKHYPPAKLVIPTFMLTYTTGRYFLTVNQFLDESSSIGDILQQVNHFVEELYSSHVPSTEVPQKVLDQEALKLDEWKALVQKTVEEIKANRAKKIVLAREIRVKLNQEAHIGQMLRKLEEAQPNSYVFAHESGDDCFLGATPERLVLVEGKELLSTCLAGTAPRGETAEADQLLADGLLGDEKNLEEHHYVVQMIKHHIALYCDRINIPDEPVIYPLKNLQHLYTPVQATLKNGHDVFDLIKSLHPTPALGGVPREKALAFIREEEFIDRGWYGAPVGWLDSGQHSEFAVAIRSGLVQYDEVSLFAGCGVMRDSDPEMEYEETKVKLLPMLDVLEDYDESH